MIIGYKVERCKIYPQLGLKPRKEEWRVWEIQQLYDTSSTVKVPTGVEETVVHVGSLVECAAYVNLREKGYV